MKLQIALDTLNEQECITLLDEIQDYIDIIEIGTPLVIQSGMALVQMAKTRYPQLDVLADVKIMDAGYLEAMHCFEAGADIVSVLGVSNDETILGALKAAKQYNGKILIDMICVKDMEKRTKELDIMGVDYICCHTAFDVQGYVESPLKDLKIIEANVTHAKSAVAGGVKKETIAAIKKVGAEIVIVGGAITTSKEPAKATKQIRELLS